MQNYKFSTSKYNISALAESLNHALYAVIVHFFKTEEIPTMFVICSTTLIKYRLAYYKNFSVIVEASNVEARTLTKDEYFSECSKVIVTENVKLKKRRLKR